MYRFFADLLQPFTLLFVALIVTLVILRRKTTEPSRALRWLTIWVVLLTVLCLPVTAYLAQATLEWPYPPQVVRPEGAAIVVLSGWAFRPDGIRTEALLGMDSQFRCQQAAEVYRQTGPCPVYVTGGKVKPDDIGPTLAELMRDFLVIHGVAAEDIVIEDQSRSTYENAQFASALLQKAGINRIVLVTTASHLWRAVRSFEATGLEVTPSGCDYQTANFNWTLVTFLPHPDGAAGVHRAFHEWVGLVLYWVQGRL